MQNTHTALGLTMAMMTAFFWAISPICFAGAGRRIGSSSVACLRIALAGVLLLAFTLLGICLPSGRVSLPNSHQAGWMALSGILGMGIGDLLIYRALVLIGPELTTQLLLLAPLASVGFGWIYLGERLGLRAFVGASLILCGTSYAVYLGQRSIASNSGDYRRNSNVGILCAAGGALSTGAGAVAGRMAFQAGPPADAVMMTTLRVLSAACFLWAAPVIRGEVLLMVRQLKDRFVLSRIATGTLAGPILGMVCYVTALKNIPAGLVSTLVATSPLFVLPMLAIRHREPIPPRIFIATIIAVLGVGLVCAR